MIEILKKFGDNIADVVSKTEIKIGDEIVVGRTIDGEIIKKSVTDIHEQRKERGVYSDESKRRMWAKISY